MGLWDIMRKPLKNSASSFLDRPEPEIDHKKVKDIATTILESASATKEQRQKAMKMLGEARRAE